MKRKPVQNERDDNMNWKHVLCLIVVFFLSIFALTSCNSSETTPVPAVEDWDGLQNALSKSIGGFIESGDYHLTDSFSVDYGQWTTGGWDEMENREYPVTLDYIHQSSESYYQWTQSLRIEGDDEPTQITQVAAIHEKYLLQSLIPMDKYAMPVVIDGTENLAEPDFGFGDPSYLLDLPEPKSFQAIEKGKCSISYSYYDLLEINPLAEWFDETRIDHYVFSDDLKETVVFVFSFTFSVDGSVIWECHPEPIQDYHDTKIVNDWVFNFSFQISPVGTFQKIDVFDGSYLVSPFTTELADIPTFSSGDTVEFYAGKTAFTDNFQYWVKIDFPKAGVYEFLNKGNDHFMYQFFLTDLSTPAFSTKETGKYWVIDEPASYWLRIGAFDPCVVLFSIDIAGLTDYGDTKNPVLVTEKSIDVTLEGINDRICLQFPEIGQGLLIFRVVSSSILLSDKTAWIGDVLQAFGSSAFSLTADSEIYGNPSSVYWIAGKFSGSFTLEWDFFPSAGSGTEDVNLPSITSEYPANDFSIYSGIRNTGWFSFTIPQTGYYDLQTEVTKGDEIIFWTIQNSSGLSIRECYDTNLSNIYLAAGTYFLKAQIFAYDSKSYVVFRVRVRPHSGT